MRTLATSRLVWGRCHSTGKHSGPKVFFSHMSIHMSIRNRKMEKLPGVFLAGADYHAGFGNGYIEGAIRAGQAAAELAAKR